MCISCVNPLYMVETFCLKQMTIDPVELPPSSCTAAVYAFILTLTGKTRRRRDIWKNWEKIYSANIAIHHFFSVSKLTMNSDFWIFVQLIKAYGFINLNLRGNGTRVTWKHKCGMDFSDYNKLKLGTFFINPFHGKFLIWTELTNGPHFIP